MDGPSGVLTGRLASPRGVCDLRLTAPSGGDGRAKDEEPSWGSGHGGEPRSCSGHIPSPRPVPLYK